MPRLVDPRKSIVQYKDDNGNLIKETWLVVGLLMDYLDKQKLECEAHYKDGKLHREDGPALINENGSFYYLNGRRTDLSNRQNTLIDARDKGIAEEARKGKLRAHT